MTSAAAYTSYVDSVSGISVDYPSSWTCLQKGLPDYVYPQQVFSLSNYVIAVPASLASVWDPEGDAPDYPLVAGLPGDAVFSWMYFFLAPDGPSDYGLFSPPITFNQGRCVDPPVGDLRWPNLVQWEFGFVSGNKVFSLWVWVGKTVATDTATALANVLASIKIA